MTDASEIRRGRHRVFNLHIHLVFVSKYRRHVFTKAILADMREVFGKVCADFEAELIEFEGEDDHGMNAVRVRAIPPHLKEEVRRAS